MKKSKRIFYLIILAFLSCTCLAGCSSHLQESPPDTVALVNNQAITTQDIEDEVIIRKIGVKMAKLLREDHASIPETQTEAFLRALGRTEDELSGDEKQYLSGRERSSIDQPINMNLIFNLTVREEVLYQEAVKQGHMVSQIEAQKVQKLVNEVSDQAGAQEYNRIKAGETAILKEFGFNSRNDYEEWLLPRTARHLTIRSMQNQFDRIIAEQYPQLSAIPLMILQCNAWEDYTEFLLKQSSLDIKQANYVLDYYAKPWESGKLDLKSNDDSR
ncbi:MAG: hypothetical protein ACOX0F_07990 [Syntrophomonadaceae bacterium]